MSNETEYNGWTNYETWAVNLWMDNEEGSQRFWADRAEEHVEDSGKEPKYSGTYCEATCNLADEIQQSHDEARPDVEGVFSDLLGAALSEVNWREIADHLVQDVEIEEEEEEVIAD